MKESQANAVNKSVLVSTADVRKRNSAYFAQTVRSAGLAAHERIAQVIGPPRFDIMAEDTFKITLQDLCAKVDELTDDLANQDAEAFLNHSKFLNNKFGAADSSRL